MKLSHAMAVLRVILLGLASSLTVQPNATAQNQGHPATMFTPNQPNLQLWRDPNIIEDLKNVEFDFNSDLTSEQLALDANGKWLKDHPNVRVRLSGYADPRGDIVYNLALSHRRAEKVKQELVRMGVGENRIEFATGWGELYPNCLESTEECWKQNRRVEFVRATD